MNAKQITLQRIENLKTIESEKLYTYSLIHQYDIDTIPLFFSVHIAPTVINPLIAYIEFIQEEYGDESWSIGKEIIVKIINELYSKVDYKNHNLTYYEIDHYYIREFWCGTQLANSYKPFERDQLISLVVSMAAQEKATFEAKEGESI